MADVEQKLRLVQATGDPVEKALLLAALRAYGAGKEVERMAEEVRRELGEAY